MRLLAKIISRLFDPFIEIPLILIGVVGMAYLNGFRWRFWLLMFVLDALIPGIAFLKLFLSQKKRDWDLHKRQLRLPLFRITVVSHGFGVAVAYVLNRHPLAEILLGFWLLAVVMTLITHYWKISIHTAVNMTLIMTVLIFVDTKYWYFMAIVVAVGWARVVDRDHTIAQVAAGALLPMLLLPSVYWWLGIL